MNTFCALVTTLALVAQTAAPNPSLGRWLRKEGQSLYAKEQYPQALKMLQKAYKTDPVPAVFVDIARCHHKLGNTDAAVAAIERYLSEVPDAPDKAEVEALLAEVRGEAPAETPAEEPIDLGLGDEPTAPVDAPAVAPVDNPLDEPAAPAEQPATAPPPPSAAAPVDEGEPLWKSPILWIAVGAGALVVIVGSATGLAIASRPAAEPEGSLGTFDLRTP